jgi:hypothetical protein
MKMIILLIIILQMMSCAYYSIYVPDFWEYDESQVPEQFNNVKEIARYVNSRITYKSDGYTKQGLKANYWQSPSETLERGKGDCEDKALLLLAIARKKLGKKGHLLVVDTTGDYKSNHAVAEFGNTQIEINGKEVNHSIIKRWTYDEIPYEVKRTYGS